MNETICPGMLVDLLPYEAAIHHWGINKTFWDSIRNNNPHIVSRISPIRLLDTHFVFGDASVFELHEEMISTPIDDLI